ncbi:MAG TPA: hypothetical protein VFR78_06475 [Pyrinomonadaceae bacterium]|nr:hypothetical protein [Pyrinomonadaceae bacterium]
MQLAGGEKKIQALFCELSRADQSITPRFEKLWNRAQTTNPVRSFSRSVAIIAAGVAVAVACSMALWLRFKSVETPPSVVKKTESISTPVEQKILVASNPKKQKRVTRQKKSKLVVTREPIALSRWQSPTAILMESPSNALLKMPPQLDQSVRELESFLPTEVKETKQ